MDRQRQNVRRSCGHELTVSIPAAADRHSQGSTDHCDGDLSFEAQAVVDFSYQPSSSQFTLFVEPSVLSAVSIIRNELQYAEPFRPETSRCKGH